MSEEKKDLPLNLDGKVVGTADVTLNDDGSYNITAVHINDPEVSRKFFDIDYSGFSFVYPQSGYIVQEEGSET